jgi:hypothetical protein
MFTPGRIVFVIVFVIAFVIMLIWAYRKESALNKIQFVKVYRILLAMLLIFLTLFLIVRMRKYF